MSIAEYLPFLLFVSIASRSLRCVPAASIQLGRTDLCLLQKLCLRQNQISHIEFPPNIGSALRELDLYDNLISHIKGLDSLVHLTSLDLSFNKIKHLKNIDHMKDLTDIYFVQNKIQKIEGLDGLRRLRNLELAANRIRVGR